MSQYRRKDLSPPLWHCCFLRMLLTIMSDYSVCVSVCSEVYFRRTASLCHQSLYFRSSPWTGHCHRGEMLLTEEHTNQLDLIQWWPKLLERLAYLRGFSCFCWIGHYITIKQTIAGTTCDWRHLLKHWKLESRDLSPIEQIWGELENKLDRSIVHSKDSLWLELQKAWDNISVEFSVNTVYLHYARETVIAAKDGHTKY